LVLLASFVTLVAVVAWLPLGETDGPPSTKAPAADDAAAPDELQGLLVGHEVISTEPVTYSPDRSRVWDTNGALHQVTVVAGTLSVEDDHGHRRNYVAGESYAAGWAPYIAANRTDATPR
jgi:hypothetical protein